MRWVPSILNGNSTGTWIASIWSPFTKEWRLFYFFKLLIIVLPLYFTVSLWYNRRFIHAKPRKSTASRNNDDAQLLKSLSAQLFSIWSICQVIAAMMTSSYNNLRVVFSFHQNFRKKWFIAFQYLNFVLLWRFVRWCYIDGTRRKNESVWVPAVF